MRQAVGISKMQIQIQLKESEEILFYFFKKKRVYDGFLPISGKPLKSTVIEKPAVYKYEIFKNKYCTTKNLSENYLS